MCTHPRTEKKSVYLSLITGMYSRRIVDWSLSESLSIGGSLSTLKTVFKQSLKRRPQIHHSDNGGYPCYENALAERVNGILKDEYLLDDTLQEPFANTVSANAIFRRLFSASNFLIRSSSLRIFTCMTVYNNSFRPYFNIHR